MAKDGSYMQASMWNLLPVNIRNLNNKVQFKYEIRDRLKMDMN